MVVSHMFYFQPYLGKIPILTIIFFKGGKTPPTRNFTYLAILRGIVTLLGW